MQILTDSLEVVRAMCCVTDASTLIKNVVVDILDLVPCFDFINALKATRRDVRCTHKLARRRL